MNSTILQLNQITNSLHSFFSLVDYSESKGKGIIDELSSHSLPYFSVIETLHQSMLENGTAHRTFMLWLKFYNQYKDRLATPEQRLESYNHLRDSFEQIRQKTPSGEFAGTGLWIVEDSYPGLLLSHQMKNKDFEWMVQNLYNPLLQLIDCADPLLNESIRKDLRMILSKPSGRNLVRAILNLNSMRLNPIRLEIVKGKEFNFIYTQAPLYTISYELEKSTTTIHNIPSFGFLSLYSPNFVTLFHELVHLRHHLSSTAIYNAMTLEPQNLYTNSEELRTIENENEILEEYQLPTRLYHIEGQKFSRGPTENLGRAVQFRLMGDLFRDVQMQPEEATQQVERVLEAHPKNEVDDSALLGLFDGGGINHISPLRPPKRRKQDTALKNPVTLFPDSPADHPLLPHKPSCTLETLEAVSKQDLDSSETPPLESPSDFELKIPPLEPPTPPEEEITTSYQGTTE